jgi:myo-inositol-1(or 4)-monophosphatase
VADRIKATLNGAPIRVSGRDAEAGMRMPVDPQFATARLWPEPWDIALVPKPNSIALRLALVADGSADGVADMRRTNEWDVAAASRILETAGGIISDRGGQPFRFNKTAPHMAGIVAATPALHGRLAWRLETARAALIRAGYPLQRDEP